MLRMSRHEHFSRLSCLPEGFRGGLLYFMKMETTEQVISQAGWFKLDPRNTLEDSLAGAQTGDLTVISNSKQTSAKRIKTPRNKSMEPAWTRPE